MSILRIWMVLSAMLLVGGVWAAPKNQPAKKTPKIRWTLAYQEQFNKSQLNTNVWVRIPKGSSDWNKHMSTDPSLLEIEKNKLYLIGKKTDVPDETRPFITGGIMTKDKLLLHYGKIEVRVKLEGAQGAWPAIWLLPNDGRAGWPNGGEIDVMERLNFDDFVYQTVHSGYTLTQKQTTNPPNGGRAKIKPDDFNTYGIEVLPDKIVWYINGEETFSYAKLEGKEGQFPWTEPLYLMIDMQLQGKWVGPVKMEDLPVKMTVDWVKFYTGRCGGKQIGALVWPEKLKQKQAAEAKAKAKVKKPTAQTTRTAE